LLQSLRRHWLALVVAVTGVLLSVGAYQAIREELGARHQLEFQWVAQDRIRALKKGIREGLDAVRSLRDLFEAAGTLDERAFGRFAGALVARYRGIHALGWLPLVRADQRAGFEREAARELPGYRILEPAGEGPDPTRPAATREWYFPVRYQQSDIGAGLVAGADQAGLPAHRALLEQAWSDGRMLVTGRIPLAPAALSQYGFMAFQPVYTGAPRPEHLRGFVVGVFRIADLADAAMRLLEPRGVEFLVQDESAAPAAALLDFYVSRLDRRPDAFQEAVSRSDWDQSGSPKVTETFDVANRRWSMTCSATHQFRSGEGFGEGHWIVLGGGLALTLIMTLFILHTRAGLRVRLRIEEELRRSEQKLRVLFHQSPDVIMTVDRQGAVLIVNRPMPGVPAAAAGDSLGGLPERAQARFREALERVFRTGEADGLSYAGEGSSWWELRIVPLREARQVSAAMVIATDVTEKRVLEAHAIRNARLASLGVLAASVAHEINNPNNAIQFNASILTRSWEDLRRVLERHRQEHGEFTVGGVPVAKALEGMPRLLEGIARSAQRIQTIVGNLKHMARPDQGELDHRVDLGEVLHTSLSILQSQIQKHTDQCRLDLPEALPLVRGNPQQLEQVFINLLLNALQALPDRTAEVTLSAAAEADGERVRVWVSDRGCGIPEAIRDRVADPFFTTKGSAGTGLGLSISARIVQAHGGRLEIAARPGGGTEVSVWLPVAAS
jgi:signal transduction histidine kinase